MSQAVSWNASWQVFSIMWTSHRVFSITWSHWLYQTNIHAKEGVPELWTHTNSSSKNTSWEQSECEVPEGTPSPWHLRPAMAPVVSLGVPTLPLQHSSVTAALLCQWELCDLQANNVFDAVSAVEQTLVSDDFWSTILIMTFFTYMMWHFSKHLGIITEVSKCILRVSLVPAIMQVVKQKHRGLNNLSEVVEISSNAGFLHPCCLGRIT